MVTGRWVLFNPSRLQEPRPRPGGPARTFEKCPFCPGNESLAGREIYAVRAEGSAPDGPGWSLRVVPNRVPLLGVEGHLERREQGIYDRMNGIGAHEVIIESPQHGPLSAADLARSFRAFRERCLDLRRDQRLRHLVMVRGCAGREAPALEHPYAQVLATPVVPIAARETLFGARRYFDYHERCPWCDILDFELEDRRRLILETDSFAALAPYASRAPFEILLVPREHGHDFGAAPDGVLDDLGAALERVLDLVSRALGGPPCLTFVRTAPLRERCDAEFHWHVEVVPELFADLGVERATGIPVNGTLPEEAAAYLRRLETQKKGPS